MPKDQWNAWGTYTFTEGAIRGFDLGFGVTHAGARQITQTQRSTAFETYSTLIGYSTRFNAFGRRMNTRFQLNVDNLFGNDTLVFRTFDTYDYNFIPPRKLTFSASVQF